MTDGGVRPGKVSLAERSSVSADARLLMSGNFSALCDDVFHTAVRFFAYGDLVTFLRWPIVHPVMKSSIPVI